jgi:5-methylthioadenosine/S-adenosylhomocysteine deaminase
VFDPVSTLVYSAQGNQVSHVWVNGKLSLEQGRLVHMDERDLLPRARDWAGKIR